MEFSGSPRRDPVDAPLMTRAEESGTVRRPGDRPDDGLVGRVDLVQCRGHPQCALSVERDVFEGSGEKVSVAG